MLLHKILGLRFAVTRKWKCTKTETAAEFISGLVRGDDFAKAQVWKGCKERHQSVAISWRTCYNIMYNCFGLWLKDFTAFQGFLGLFRFVNSNRWSQNYKDFKLTTWRFLKCHVCHTTASKHLLHVCVYLSDPCEHWFRDFAGQKPSRGLTWIHLVEKGPALCRNMGLEMLLKPRLYVRVLFSVLWFSLTDLINIFSSCSFSKMLWQTHCTPPAQHQTWT